MLGIDDPWVVLAYVLCFLSTAACVMYGWRNWNRGDESVRADDVRWAQHEDKIEEQL